MGNIMRIILFLFSLSLPSFSFLPHFSLSLSSPSPSLSLSLLDLDYWLQETEAKLSSDDLGRDIDSVEALAKKHQLLEAELLAQQVTIATRSNKICSFMSSRLYICTCTFIKLEAS